MRSVRIAMIGLATVLLLLWLHSTLLSGKSLQVSAPQHRYLFITSASGRLVVYWSTSLIRPRQRPADYGFKLTRANRNSVAHLGRTQWWVWFGADAGQVLHGTLDSADVWVWGFNIPWWYLAAPSLGIGLLCLRKELLKRPPGSCPTCGYDLRATPERCPECGSLPEQAIRT